MSRSRFDAARYVEEATALLGLELDPAHLPGVVENMDRLATMAELVMSFPLDEAVDPAPIFRP